MKKVRVPILLNSSTVLKSRKIKESQKERFLYCQERRLNKEEIMKDNKRRCRELKRILKRLNVKVQGLFEEAELGLLEAKLKRWERRIKDEG